MQEISSIREPLQWLTLRQPAKHLCVHPRTIRRWADGKGINCVRTPGGHRLFRYKDLQSFLEARTETGQNPLRKELMQGGVQHTRRQLGSASVKRQLEVDIRVASRKNPAPAAHCHQEEDDS